MSIEMSIDRDQIALDVLLAFLRNANGVTITPDGVGTYCQVAYAFADGFLSESARRADGEDAEPGPEPEVVLVDTDEGPEIDTADDPGMKVGTVSTGTDRAITQEELAAAFNAARREAGINTIDTESKAARTKRIEDEALVIYMAYPRKVCKVKAVQRICEAIRGGFDSAELLRRTRVFAATNPHKGLPATHVDNFCPYPSTWYYQQRYLDEQFDVGAAEDVTTNRFLTDSEETDAR